MQAKFDIKTAGSIVIILLLAFEFVYVPWESWVESKKESIQRSERIIAKQGSAIERQALYSELNKYMETEFIDKIKGFSNAEEQDDGALLWLQFVDSVLKDDSEIKVNAKRPDKSVIINDSVFVYIGSINFQGPASRVLDSLQEFDDISSGNQIRNLSLVMRNKNTNTLVAQFEFVKIYKKL
ncbi:hypothetical protein GBO14_18280 [Pseudoalteromonas shioyasakiensis]|uniref:hypothetical protein n=1 Tax=Pseudoalteromonas shioyasakiensis TaxID=1190813 RepID=UPI0020944989|nr:hypothetical protein [Pseudoalteromonas shioyasakiensis]MCO6356671.1 hypothetical protein [Pseudoalteromonas shioyasakiensis]